MTHSMKVERLYKRLQYAILDLGEPGCIAYPEIFFPEDKQGRASREDHWEIAFAKGICQDCPIRNLCLEYALTADEEFGIWGGFTTSERRALLKKKR